MSIIASFSHMGASLQVEVIDVFECGGVKLATVRATAGQPFMGGDKWPVRTEYATIKAGELSNLTEDPDPAPKPPTLLTLAEAAFEAHRGQPWYTSETIWIWGRRAFLSCNGHEINLHLVGFRKYVHLYWLDNGAWQKCRDATIDYIQWARSARESAR